ncbi:MAG: permease prefix domain 1-containing protein [Planctomycetota bacterium]
MSDFRDLTERATHRLRRDRELRLEVSRELESHLEASAAEYRAADYSEEDARAAAVKAFGDPDDVADALWDANRFRLKLRAWAWWGARATLLPACVAAVIVFILSGMTTLISVNHAVDGYEQGGVYNQWKKSRLQARMTPQQRLIFYGDEGRASEGRAARWRPLRDAYPDEPLYQLHLIAQMLSDLFSGGPEVLDLPEGLEQVRELRAELDRGAALDPDNGIYALIDAGLSAKRIDFHPDPPYAQQGGFGEDYPMHGGSGYGSSDQWGDVAADAEHDEDWPVAAEPIVVMVLKRDGDDGEREALEIERFPTPVDRAAVDAALHRLADAADHPYVAMHAVDRIRHRLDQLPPPESMLDYMIRVATEVGTLLPAMASSRHVARVACAEAITRAEAGDAAGALAILDDLDSVNARFAASSDTLIMLLVSWSMESLERGTRVAVWRVLGDEQRAGEALAESDTLMRFWWREWEEPKQNRPWDAMEKEAGLFLGVMMPAVPGYAVDPTAFRKAEYTLIDRVALTWGLVVLVFISALAPLQGVWSVWRKRDQPALLLWMGWRRLAWVLGLAVGVPIALFMVWSALPWSGRGFGLNYSFVALTAYLPLTLGVVVLLWVLGSEALRQRGRALGLAVPAKRGLRGLAVLGLAIAWLSATLWGAFWWAENPIYVTSLGWVIAIIVASVGATIVAVGWIVSEIVWLRGVENTRDALRKGLLVSLVAAFAFGGVLPVLTLLTVDDIDRVPFAIAMGGVGVLLGVVSGLFWVAGRPGPTSWFARSVVRSMGPTLGIAVLVLALVVGMGLNLRERALAQRLVADSPTFVNYEIERSQGKVIRAYLAGDAARPPRRP